MRPLVKLSEVYDVREEMRSATGLVAHWISDGGSDGMCAWLYSTERRGYVICHACQIGVTIEQGERRLPSPYRRCEHMLRAAL